MVSRYHTIEISPSDSIKAAVLDWYLNVTEITAARLSVRVSITVLMSFVPALETVQVNQLRDFDTTCVRCITNIVGG